MPRSPIGLSIALSLSLLLAAPLAAQQAAPPFSDDAAVRAIIKDRVDTKRSTGIVVGLLESDGRTRVVAYNERAHGEPDFDQDTVFEIGSITKVFTTSILADMIARGDVKLDDPVAKYLPATVKVPSRNGREITLEDLATQTSGLPRMPTNLAPKDSSNPYADYTAEQMFAFLSGYTLTRDIGAQYEYSNLGVGLLGQALCRRAGQSYEALVTERILKPLGMTMSGVALTPEMKAHLAVGHGATGDPVANWDLPAMAGAGALRSTVTDLFRFLSAQLHPERSTIAKNMALTHTARRDTGPGGKIGLAWQIRLLPNRQILWHNGGTGGYRTWVGFDPAAGRAAIVLTNSATGADDIGFHLLDSTLPLAPPPAPVTARKEIALAAGKIAPYVGEYELAPGFSIVFTQDGDQLLGQATGQGRLRYWPESETDFFLKEVDAQIRFVRDAAGTVTGLVLMQGGQQVPAKKIH